MKPNQTAFATETREFARGAASKDGAGRNIATSLVNLKQNKGGGGNINSCDSSEK